MALGTSRKQKKFTKIYDRYLDNIYRFVYIKVNSSQIAEDLTSEVFLKTWEKYQARTGIKNPKAYLYTVARNLVIDFYRQKGQASIMSIEEKDIEVPGQDDLENVNKDQENLAQVRTALAKIRPEYQDVIILRHIDGLAIKDIAKIIDKSKGATRVMLHRAMEELKEKLNV